MGSEVTFSCDEGHQLMGVAKITCLESGEWSHLIPYCERMLSKFPHVYGVWPYLESQGGEMPSVTLSQYSLYLKPSIGLLFKREQKPRAALELLEIFTHSG